MSLSREALQDDRQLVRYLLGLLSERDTQRLDEASIADDEVASRLVTLENDLVDAYVKGTLEPELRHRFESFYLATPRRREKVEFARRFLQVVDRAGEAAGPAGPKAAASSPEGGTREAHSLWSRLRSPLMAAAALLLLMLGVVGLQNFRLRQGLSEVRTALGEQDRRARELATELAASRAAEAESSRALQRARESLAAGGQPSLAGRPAATSTSSRPAYSTGSFAIVLFPQTRSLGMPPAIAVLRDADRVAFELRLESTEFAGYRVVLKDPGTGRIVWRSATLSPGVERGASFLSVDVPARMLGAQHYSFELEGLDASGHGEIISSYTFQIDRR